MSATASSVGVSVNSNKNKVLLLNDTEWHYHFGCTAKSMALKKQIQDLGFSIDSIQLPDQEKWNNVPLTKTDFQSDSKFTLFCETNPELIKRIKEANAVVINGEGTIHSGIRPGPCRLLYLSYIAKTRFQKNVQIINHQVYYTKDFANSHPVYDDRFKRVNETDKEAHELYQMVYQILDFVAIREHISFGFSKDWNKNTVQSFDTIPLYIRDQYKIPSEKSKEKTLVIAGSVAWQPEAISSLVKYLKNMHSKGYQIQILSGAKGNPSKDDQLFVKALKENWSGPGLESIEAKELDEWLNVLYNASLLVSGRFSHTIAAACLNTPFITLNSSTYKIHALLQRFRMEEPLNYLDPNLLGALKSRTIEILEHFTLPNNILKDLCTEAEKNFIGLKGLKNSLEGGKNYCSLLEILEQKDS